jgi:hypothetical protein
MILNCDGESIMNCPMCFGTNIVCFSYTGVTCALCHGKPLSKERDAAFRLLLPSDVLFWAGGGPILSEELFFSIIDKLGSVGL